MQNYHNEQENIMTQRSMVHHLEEVRDQILG